MTTSGGSPRTDARPEDISLVLAVLLAVALVVAGSAWYLARARSLRAAAQPGPASAPAAPSPVARSGLESATDASGRWVYLDPTRTCAVFGTPDTRPLRVRDDGKLVVELGPDTSIDLELRAGCAITVDASGWRESELVDGFDQLRAWVDAQRAHGGSLDPHASGAPKLQFQ
jgi:hypothetical protein